MKKLNEKIKSLTKAQKSGCLIVILILFLVLVISIPSFAKFKNRVTLYNEPIWDGMVATSYKSGDGTEDNPYIISNGSELAYFSDQLKNTNYENKYFELSNDIVLNDGVFDYNETDGLTYILNNVKYYVKEYTKDYYDNANYEGNPIGSINIFPSLSNFKGNLNGNSYVIFGTYISQDNVEKLGLFTDLEGVVADLYVENSIVYGGKLTGGIASNTNGSTINNVVYEGFVVGSNKTLTHSVDIAPSVVSAPTTELTTSLQIQTPQIYGNIVSTKLKGEYVVSDQTSNTSIKINGVAVEGGNFELDLGLNLQNQIQITTLSDKESVIVNFTNLKYEIEYNNSITSGIVGSSTNTSLVNVINKANIQGNYISSGIIGKVNNSLQINRVYNLGYISSNNIASGMIGLIENNSSAVSILNSYNAGDITSKNSGAIISKANSNLGLINIENTFNVSDNYSINAVINSTVNISNCYNTNGLSIYSGITTGSFVQTNLTNLYNENFLVTTLGYNKFIDLKDVEANTNNVWVIDNKVLPYLYIDSSSDPVASININKHSWNNLSSDLDIINLGQNIIFNIEDLSQTRPVKEKYYYISNSMTPLTHEQLNSVTWNEYKEIVQVDNSGYYVLYAKIVEYDGTITYINSDVLALNKSGFSVNISLGDKKWDSLNSDLNEIYINKEESIYLYAVNDLIGIQSVQYYVSTEILSEEQFNTIQWMDYIDNITINTLGKYIVYAKVIDNNQNIKYVNTDYIIYNGYQENLYLGNSKKEYNSNYITDNSTLTLDFLSDIELEFFEGYKHSLVSNVLLPLNTKISLIDYNQNKVYSYKIDSQDDIYGYADDSFATYSFNLFKEVGTVENNNYDDTVLYNKKVLNEKYTIILDFSETSIVDNYYNVNFSLIIEDTLNNKVIQTLNNTIQNINIYKDDSDINSSLSLTSNYNNGIINYNTDSVFSLNLNNNISYNILDNKNIINTGYEEKNIGLEIKIVDANGTIIPKDNLKDMIIKLNNQEYTFGTNGTIKINVGNALEQTTQALTVTTKQGSTTTLTGTYYLRINNYLSDDGYNYSVLGLNTLDIPIVIAENQIQYGTSLNVDILSDSVVIPKENQTNKVVFNINLLRQLENPIVKISLYEKENLTAYNQNYVLVDLNNYTANQFTITEDFGYSIATTSTQYELELILEKFNNNGYKYLFELYDGVTKVDRIEKYFIIK